MQIVPNTWAVFWRKPGTKQSFHADLGRLPGETAQQARQRFSSLWPQDEVLGVKDEKGRWAA